MRPALRRRLVSSIRDRGASQVLTLKPIICMSYAGASLDVVPRRYLRPGPARVSGAPSTPPVSFVHTRERSRWGKTRPQSLGTPLILVWAQGVGRGSVSFRRVSPRDTRSVVRPGRCLKSPGSRFTFAPRGISFRSLKFNRRQLVL